MFNPPVMGNSGRHKTKMTMKTLVKSNGRLLPEFPSLLDEFLGKDFFEFPLTRFSGSTTMPSVNIKETDSAYEMEVAAPGLEKNNFKVELTNDMLVISAQAENKKEEKEESYTRKEFSYTSFQRSFQLPESMVLKDKITAKYTNGILHVTVPKAADTQHNASRIIEIG